MGRNVSGRNEEQRTREDKRKIRRAVQARQAKGFLSVEAGSTTNGSLLYLRAKHLLGFTDPAIALLVCWVTGRYRVSPRRLDGANMLEERLVSHAWRGAYGDGDPCRDA